MMQYEKNNYNFIPKEKRETIPDNVNVDLDIKNESNGIEFTENLSINKEKERLLIEIEKLKIKLDETESLLIKKDNEIYSLVKEYNEYLEYERNPQEFLEIKGQIQDVDKLNNEIAKLNEENLFLNNQVLSYKEHIQYLYLILLVLVII